MTKMNDNYLRACRREPTDRTPIWIMRQAGRYLPEYRALRERYDFLTMCKTPELAAEVTLQPVNRLDVDAAILFSDIMVLAEPLGLDLRFSPGPVIEHPVRSMADVEKLRPVEPETDLAYVLETVRILSGELKDRIPFIGFAAAPLTLATYLLEGGGSKTFDKFKRLLYSDPSAAHALMAKLATATTDYLNAQILAGAQAIQLFDTWAGLLSAPQYHEFGLRYSRQVLDNLRPSGVPLIYFGLNAGHLLSEIKECGSDVVGADWRQPLDSVSRQLDNRYVIQGNLDPCTLFATSSVIEQEVGRIKEEATRIPGHIFNLGHGILPTTPIESVETLIRAVHADNPG